MTYLYWYLGIGAIAFAAFFVFAQLTRKIEPQSLRNLFDAANPDHQKPTDCIFNRFIAPIIAGVLLISIWPIPVYIELKEKILKRNKTEETDENEFIVKRAHLLVRLTLSQVEAREVVFDPLGAVPNLPFGHLNGAWRTFIESLKSSDEVWSFATRWETTWGHKEVRAGYAVVRHGVPRSYFLTMCKEVFDEPQSAKISGENSAYAKKANSNRFMEWLRKQVE